MHLDASTFFFSMGMIAWVMSAMSFSMDKTIGLNARGLQCWGWSMLGMGSAFFLIACRRALPFFWGYQAADGILCVAIAMAVAAHVLFLGIKMPKKELIGVCLLAFGLLAMASGAQDLRERARWVTVALAGPLGWLMFRLGVMIFSHAPWKRVASAGLSGFSLMVVGTALWVRGFWASAGWITEDVYGQTGLQLWLMAAAGIGTVSVSMAFIFMAQDKVRREILESSRRDGLTGLYTRAAFMELAHGIAQADTERFAMVMVDIDNFKKINDTMGHSVGDVALAHAGRLLSSCARISDVVGRYGGEEFCVLLREAGETEARSFSERLVVNARKQKARLPKGGEVGFTVSAGYAWGVSGKDQIEALIEKADAALYEAKRSGRDQALPAWGIS